MKTTDSPRVLVVGSLNQDLTLHVDRLPSSGESRLGANLLELPGGKGGNQAVAAAKLGATVTFCGCVGVDGTGEALVKSLAREKVITAFVAQSESKATGRAIIIVEPTGQNRIVVYPGANHDLRPKHVEAAFLSGRFDAVIVNLEIATEAIDAVRQFAQESQIPVILDAGPAQSYDLAKLRGLTILSPNETETTALTGLPCANWEEASFAALRLLAQTRARHVVIKMGARGALLCDEEGLQRFPAFPVQAVDATAAGDAFTSALTIYFLRTGSVRAAMPMALAAGALTATRPGAQVALPNEVEVLAFTRERLQAVPT